MNPEHFLQENNINPEISSIREEELILNQIKEGEELFVDQNTGERFHRIHEFPNTQKFISLILKGIVNTADIVEYKGQYFSHEQNISKITSKEAFSIDEINADRFILSKVFGDKDHSGSNLNEENKNAENIWSAHPESNMNIDKNSNKKYYYDFGAADLADTNSYDDYYKENIRTSLKKISASERSIIHTKAKKILSELFLDDNLNAFQAVIEKSKLLEELDQWKHPHTRYIFPSNNTKSFNSKIEALFDDFKNRFEILYTLTEPEVLDSNN